MHFLITTFIKQHNFGIAQLDAGEKCSSLTGILSHQTEYNYIDDYARTNERFSVGK